MAGRCAQLTRRRPRSGSRPEPMGTIPFAAMRIGVSDENQAESVNDVVG